MGSSTPRRNKSLLIDSGKGGNQSGEESDPVYFVFQITEDIRLRSIRTPCVSNVSLKGPWSLRMWAYINIFLCVLLISHMWLIIQPVPSLWLSFLWAWFPLARTHCQDLAQGLRPLPASLTFRPTPFSPSHWAFKSLPPLLPDTCFLFISKPSRTPRFNPRSQRKVQVIPSATPFLHIRSIITWTKQQ